MITWILNRYGAVVHRLRTGGWCTEHRWGPWHTVDQGGNKVRYCECCGWTETAL